MSRHGMFHPPQRMTPSRGGFRLFADGSSTGGDVLLRLRNTEVKLCVSWLTGEAQNGAECIKLLAKLKSPAAV